MGDPVIRAWGDPLPLHEVRGSGLQVRLEPTPDDRAKIARHLGLEGLPRLAAALTVRPWLDGAEVTGRVEAVVEQLSSVTLERFEQPLSTAVDVRVVPRGSPHAQSEESGELDLDARAPDPPDLLPGEDIDLAAIVTEHLALELDPFPRQPGEEFEYQAPATEDSPFAVLKKLKGEEP